MTDMPTRSSRPARRIQVGSSSLAFRAWSPSPVPGSRPAPGGSAALPLVLVHALGEDSSSWQGVGPALASAWRVYAPDLRGHGTSDRSGPFTVEQFTTDLEAFLDALGLHRVALAGHSAGAVPAYLFAARHPERVIRLVLEEPAPPFPAARFGVPSSLDWDATALSAELADPPPSWRDALGGVKAPTLLIAGGPGSHVDHRQLAEMAALIGDCQLTTIEAGHHVHATRPAEFAETTSAFLGDGDGHSPA
ncbi:MAG: alpha/beta fold hydrolase [Nocardiopsaceae bacterium]|nr:alpha/beta fold hydrolase [Nocardiopsaceae bacterium]